MKILILSDSHGETRWMEQAVFEECPDMIFHLGDRQRDADFLHETFYRIPLISVPGNCDLGAVDPAVAVTELAGVRIFATHGHVYGVKGGITKLGYAAMEAGADLALYGHTHIPAYDMVGKIHLLNPGAAGGARPSYAVAELKTERQITCRIQAL